MSQNTDRKKHKSVDAKQDTGAINTTVVIRLAIASVVFAVSLIIDMPEFISVILLVLAAIAAGYDILMQAVTAVEEGDYFDTPVVVTFIVVIAYFVGFSVEGAALLILYQIGLMLVAYADDHTKKAAMELLRGQDGAVIDRMNETFAKEGSTSMAIESTMKTSSGAVLKLAMIIAVAYAIALPLFTSFSYTVSIHRAITIILIATPMSIVVSIPLAARVGMCYCAQQGVTFDSAASLEAVGYSTVAVFDKAGIFADETPRIISMYSDILDSNTFMNFVAHAVYYSEQPIAKAISSVYDQEYQLEVIKDFREIPGYGVDLSINGIHVVFATGDYLSGRGVELPEENVTTGQAFYMVVANKYVGKVVISSEVNEEMENLIPSMKDVGINRCVLLTEDSKGRGQQFAESMGFSEMYPECDQEKKLAVVSEICKKPKSATLFIYSRGIEAHSDATVDMRVSKKAKFADAVVDPLCISNIPFCKQVAIRIREVSIGNAVFAFIVKSLLIVLSIIGYCNLWFAIFIDMIAGVAAILNTIRVTNDSFKNSWRYKTGR